MVLRVWLMGTNVALPSCGPHHMVEIYSFLHVVGMSGYLKQETILMVQQYPGQGEVAKSKVEVFS